MKITLIACLLYISLTSYTKSHNTSNEFTQKVPRLNHKTLQHSKRKTNIAMMFIKSAKRSRNQLKWDKNKDLVSLAAPTRIAQLNIESVLETQATDTSIGTNDIIELSEFEPQLSEFPKQTFDDKVLDDYTISAQNIIHYETTIQTPEITEYFLEAWPTFTSIRSSFIQSQLVPTVTMRYYRTLFEATTKNVGHNFNTNRFISSTSSLKDYKKRSNKIPKDKLKNEGQRKQMGCPVFNVEDDKYFGSTRLYFPAPISPYEDDEYYSSTRLYSPTSFLPSSQPVYDEQLQNYISSTQNPKKEIVKNIARTDEHNEKSLVSKCYSCGWHQRDIPHIEGCHNSFDAAEPLLKGKQVFFKSHCYNRTKTRLRSDLFLNMIYEIDERNNITFLSDPFDDNRRGSILREGDDITENIPTAPNLKVHHRKYRYQYSPNYIGGCFKRFTDVGAQVYYEKGCRAWPPIRGKSFASRRFAKVEKMLRGKTEGCVSSPMASLTPFSRGVYLWVRYHVCICQGDYCNAQTTLIPTLLYFVFFYIISISLQSFVNDSFMFR